MERHLGRIELLLDAVAGLPRVANAGLLKAGKSTLFNAICQQKELFPSSSVRCTINAQEHAVGNYVLIDTPGIDADESDTEQAEAVLKNADMVLMVHSVQNGEYIREELDFLERLASFMPSLEQRREAMIPVFTKCEGKNFGRLDDVEKALEQWQQVTGVRAPQYFTVRSLTFLKGVEQDRPKLQDLSGIPSLQEFINDEVPTLFERRVQVQRARIDVELQAMMDHLGSEYEQRFRQHQRLRHEQQKGLETIRRDANALFKHLGHIY